jgi:hypothetical protein
MLSLQKYLTTSLLFLLVHNVFACSMYKVTFGGKTMVGCNEDAWRSTSRIWFETADSVYKYGAAFTGSRLDGANGCAPQSGMNEYGLAYSRLATATPTTGIKQFSARKKITNPTLYLKQILHNCKNIEEVKTYISSYDQSYFLEDVFIYIEKSGKYLIVEPYTFIEGNDAKYVLSNFCPSIAKPAYTSKLQRYNNGTTFLQNKLDSTLEFCTALSDTMHVCRNKIGDGTLLTSIWDTKNGRVNLFFYHNYKTSISFDISQELSKGNHCIKIPELFPENKEFKTLASYKIPMNNIWMMATILGIAFFFFCSTIYFSVSALQNKSSFMNQKLLLIFLGPLLIYYIYILATNLNLFYFDAPYKDYKFTILNIMAYVPFLLLALIIPICIANKKIIQDKNWNFLSKCIFTGNTFTYIILLALFGYWRLFGI